MDAWLLLQHRWPALLQVLYWPLLMAGKHPLPLLWNSPGQVSFVAPKMVASSRLLPFSSRELPNLARFDHRGTVLLGISRSSESQGTMSRNDGPPCWCACLDTRMSNVGGASCHSRGRRCARDDSGCFEPFIESMPCSCRCPLCCACW